MLARWSWHSGWSTWSSCRRVTDGLLTTPLGLRVLVAFVVLAPLGVTLGMFMPLGLGAVSQLTEHGEEYVAWGWAVNGFASVIGSVLTTVFAMIVGFRVVLLLSVVLYLVALLAAAVPAPRDPGNGRRHGGGDGDSSGDAEAQLVTRPATARTQPTDGTRRTPGHRSTSVAHRWGGRPVAGRSTLGMRWRVP